MAKRKKSKKGIWTILAIAAATVIIGIIILVWLAGRPTPKETKIVAIYFSDNEGLYLKPEKRSIDKGALSVEARAAIEELLEGPENTSLGNTLPDGTRLLSVTVEGQTATVTSIHRVQEGYEVGFKTPKGSRFLSAGTVVAAYGRQSPLDKSLERSFVSHRSGMSGVKYHLPRGVFSEFPNGSIQLFAAEGIYCGVNRVNENEATLCFLASSGRLHPREALSALLQKNRKFRALFRADLPSVLPELSPYGAGNIFFGKRNVVENGIYMVGDAAAVIAPLAGDGIGMAIESGQLLARVLIKAKRDSLGRRETEALYTGEWRHLFRKRLAAASYLQTFAMSSVGGNLGGLLLKTFPRLAEGMIQWTRGEGDKLRPA